ncbi:rod shape-determining protein MreD [Bacillus seohaeanensis]|jgi:rod shape-determining protein MreD|uniref:Rod shape-determining protein MreD n=1 Tax=Bacillus seohaeanensis TaxID=284580 RepID=A0ABW5RTN3_9BACI
MLKKLLLPFLALACFYSESLFVTLFPGESLFSGRILIPHFLAVFLLFVCAYYNYRIALLYGFIFGFLFDIYYTEINGIYLVLFPFIIFLADKMLKVLHNNLFVFCLIVLVNLTVLEFLVYQINLIIQKTELTIMQFADWRLWPTLAFNVAFYILFSFPLRNLLIRQRKEIFDE